VDAPPPRLTPDQRAAAARLREAGIPAGLALDVAAGRIAEADALAWHAAWVATKGDARGGWVDGKAGGDVLGLAAPPVAEAVIWVGRAGAKWRSVQRLGIVPPADDKARPLLWTRAGAAGWWRVPG
jgi:hypothetical protein